LAKAQKNTAQAAKAQRKKKQKAERERSAGFVIFREGKAGPQYLVLHYEEGHRDFPKGHVETGETGLQAAKRELFEETGIKPSEIEILPGFSHAFSYTYTRDGKKFSKAVKFFLAKTKIRKISVSCEHTGAKWLPFAGAKRRLTFENAKKLLSLAHEFRKNK